MCRITKRCTPVALVIVLTFVAMGQGCGTQRMYEGEARPRDQVARIIDVDSIRTTVNGKSKTYRGGTFEVLPGRQSVAVTNVWGMPFEETRTVWFHAEAGGTYRIRQDGVKEGGLSGGGGGGHYGGIGAIGIAAVYYTARLFADNKTEDDSMYGYLWITDEADGRVVGGTPPITSD